MPSIGQVDAHIPLLLLLAYKLMYPDAVKCSTRRICCQRDMPPVTSGAYYSTLDSLRGIACRSGLSAAARGWSS